MEELSYEITIEPADSEMSIVVKRSKIAIVNLNLNSISGITLHESWQDSFIAVKFSDSTPCGLLKVRIKPNVQIEWGFAIE